MGERTINTILRLQNEGEYRAALKSCNSELKALKSQLDLTSSEFRNNANSMAALQSKGDVLAQMYAVQEQKVTSLQGALKQAEQTRDKERQTVADLQAQYAAAKKALDDYGDEVDESNEGYKKAKAEVERLTNELYKHQENLTSAERSVSTYSVQLNKAKIELNKINDQQEENNRLLEEAKSSADGCATSIDKYGNSAKKANSELGQSASSVDALANALVASGLQQKVEDVAETLLECADAASTFETSIAKVYTLADSSVVSMDSMRAGILEISGEYAVGAEQIGEAVYEALSAGVDTANVLDFVRQTTQLSVAGFTDAGNAVDVLTTILNAYGLEADQTEAIASKLVKTQDLGKVTVDQLGSVLGRIIPSAAAYGVNLDNIAAAYANMTASGINAENTTTYLSTMLDELADEGSAVAVVLREKTGKSFAELMASGMSLGDVLDILGSSVENDMSRFSGLWSSATAGKAAIALLNTGADAFNATLAEMSNASGAVAINYGKLADTSEFASRRVETATENLKIAVGDQLNPVLNDLKNAGADIMEKAAEVVANNPALVAAISGAVTALGLLTTAFSGLMIIKAVKAAMDALNISMAANPAILITTAIVGLTAALAVYASQIETHAEKVEKLTEASRGLEDAVATAEATFEDSKVAAEAAGTAVGKYIDRLEELESQGEMTSEQQDEYRMIVEQINSVMPGLNASIDAQTGLLKGGAQALREQADAWMQAALMEAAYARHKAEIDALAAAEYELAQNQAHAKRIREEMAPVSERLSEVTGALSAKEAELAAVLSNTAYAAQGNSAEAEALRSEIKALEDEEESLRAEQGRLNMELTAYEDASEACADAVDEQRSAVEAGEDAYKSYTAQLEGATASAENQAGVMSGSVTNSLEAVRKEYAALAESAKSSIESQIGLFEELSVKSNLSFDDMLKGLQSQKVAFDNYATNIETAIRRGVDEGLVAKLSDGSAESMGYLQLLSNCTDEELALINQAWRESQGSINGWVDTVAGVPDIVASLNDETYNAAYGLGGMTGDGLIAGIRSRTAGYTNEVAALANAGLNRYASENRIASPSKRWAEMAQWDVAGITSTYKQARAEVARQSADLAAAGYSAAFRARQQSAASQFGSIFPSTSRIPVASGTAAATGSSMTAGSRSVNVIQHIHSEAKTAADLMQEAQYYQERAVLLGV